jgi:hypothetical protein
MSKPIVDIAVACSSAQSPNWWGPLMGLIMYTFREGTVDIGQLRTATGALPDSKKNNQIGVIKKRWSLTDVNRNSIVNEGFLNGDAEWIFWIDDDTVPPIDAIIRLVKAGREFIAGLYFLPQEPYNPIAYKRTPENLYNPIYNYPKGGVFEVDSVGMGCTLIHRSVYQRIKNEHKVFMRYNGSIFPVHKSQVKLPEAYRHDKRRKPVVKYGEYRERVVLQDPEDDRNFPYYLLEHGRTEDHHFCELADNVGVKPWIDATITCEHWKMQPTTVEAYDNEMEKVEGIFQ